MHLNIGGVVLFCVLLVEMSAASDNDLAKIVADKVPGAKECSESESEDLGGSVLDFVFLPPSLNNLGYLEYHTNVTISCAARMDKSHDLTFSVGSDDMEFKDAWSSNMTDVGTFHGHVIISKPDVVTKYYKSESTKCSKYMLASVKMYLNKIYEGVKILCNSGNDRIEKPFNSFYPLDVDMDVIVATGQNESLRIGDNIHVSCEASVGHSRGLLYFQVSHGATPFLCTPKKYFDTCDELPPWVKVASKSDTYNEIDGYKQSLVVKISVTSEHKWLWFKCLAGFECCWTSKAQYFNMTQYTALSAADCRVQASILASVMISIVPVLVLA